MPSGSSCSNHEGLPAWSCSFLCPLLLLSITVLTVRFHCFYPRNVHMKDINNDKKWKQALQCFISMKLPQKQIESVIDWTPLQSPTLCSIQLSQKAALPGEPDQLCCTAGDRGAPKIPLHFSLWCWVHHPENCILAIGFPGKISTHFRRLRLCKT